MFFVFFFSSRRRHTRCALVAGVQTCALPISHTWEEKHNPYVRAPSGLRLVRYVLVAALEPVREGRLSNTQLVQKVAHAPAQLFDVKERGFLREGYWAEIGRASCRERVCQYVEISVVAVSLKKKKIYNI